MRSSYSVNHMRFRRFVRWTVVSMMSYTALLFLIRLFRSRRRTRILVYHHINNDPLNPFSVSPNDFEAQIRFLAQEFNIISLSDLAAYLHSGRELPPDSVVITLDDGFRDNYVNAYPILKKCEAPATIFLTVDRIVEENSGAQDLDDDRTPLYLSWAEVKEMSGDRISFGSHTLTHNSLTSLTLEQARHEIQVSKKLVEERIGEPIHCFSYPFGTRRDFDEDIRNIVAESGYVCACTSLHGTNVQKTDAYLLKRTKIEVDDGMYVFKKAMRGGLDVFFLLNRYRRFLPTARRVQRAASNG